MRALEYRNHHVDDHREKLLSLGTLPRALELCLGLVYLSASARCSTCTFSRETEDLAVSKIKVDSWDVPFERSFYKRITRLKIRNASRIGCGAHLKLDTRKEMHPLTNILHFIFTPPIFVITCFTSAPAEAIKKPLSTRGRRCDSDFAGLHRIQFEL